MKYVTHTEAGEGLIFLWKCGASLCRPFPERHRALPHYDDEAGGSEQPMKQLKPRDKITQKMTRDGAVEINETQQTAERISSPGSRQRLFTAGHCYRRARHGTP